jgi:hypothetical protein
MRSLPKWEKLDEPEHLSMGSGSGYECLAAMDEKIKKLDQKLDIVKRIFRSTRSIMESKNTLEKLQYLNQNTQNIGVAGLSLFSVKKILEDLTE